MYNDGISKMNEYFDSDEDDDGVDVGLPGTLARVRNVTPDGCQIYVELRGGQFATATWDRPFDVREGDVVVLRDGSVARAPNELWIEETWVGVVKVKLPDTTVIDGGRRALAARSDE